MSNKYPHGISTVRDLKEAIAQFNAPDDSYVHALLIRDGKPFSTLLISDVRIGGEHDKRGPATVTLEVIEGQ